jgi:hypothetical protein
VNGWKYIVERGSEDKEDNYSLYINGGKLGFEVNDKDKYSNSFDSDFAIVAKKWYTVAVVSTINEDKISATIKMYLNDGKDIKTASIVHKIGTKVIKDPKLKGYKDSYESDLYIGKQKRADTPAYFIGEMSEIKIYNVAYSEDEIKGIMKLMSLLGEPLIPKLNAPENNKEILNTDINNVEFKWDYNGSYDHFKFILKKGTQEEFSQDNLKTKTIKIPVSANLQGKLATYTWEVNAYETSSSLNEIKSEQRIIKALDRVNLNVTMGGKIAHVDAKILDKNLDNITIDWGDKTTPENISLTNVSKHFNKVHTYQIGSYTIKIYNQSEVYLTKDVIAKEQIYWKILDDNLKLLKKLDEYSEYWTAGPGTGQNLQNLYYKPDGKYSLDGMEYVFKGSKDGKKVSNSEMMAFINDEQETKAWCTQQVWYLSGAGKDRAVAKANWATNHESNVIAILQNKIKENNFEVGNIDEEFKGKIIATFFPNPDDSEKLYYPAREKGNHVAIYRGFEAKYEKNGKVKSDDKGNPIITKLYFWDGNWDGRFKFGRHNISGGKDVSDMNNYFFILTTDVVKNYYIDSNDEIKEGN